jgi:hypothetical protein
VPFIQRGNRKSHYDRSWIKPKPLVKRRHCFEVTERVDAYGEVPIPLNAGEVEKVAGAIRALPEEISAVAVCLLFPYLRSDHERQTRGIVTAELPDKAISISYEALPKWKGVRARLNRNRGRLSQARGRAPAGPDARGSIAPGSPHPRSSSSRTAARPPAPQWLTKG